MRVGIIGAGLQARRRAEPVCDFPGTELVVVSAGHQQSATRLAQALGCEAAVGWEDVVRRGDIDAIIICTPPHLHASIAIAAMQAGKHVLCEKPPTRTLEEAEAVAEVARTAKVTLKYGFNHRYHPAIQKVREWLDQGAIGKPIFIRCVYGIGGRPGHEKEWRANPEMVGGGQLMEQGIHAVDLCLWFLGEISEVVSLTGTSYWPIEPLEDNAFVLCRSRGGAVAFLHSSLTQWKNLFSFHLSGDEGYVAVEGLGGSYGTERAIRGKKDLVAPFCEEVTDFRGQDLSWREEWQEFVAAVADGREPEGNSRDGVEAMRVVLAAYESARTGRLVRL